MSIPRRRRRRDLNPRDADRVAPVRGARGRPCLMTDSERCQDFFEPRAPRTFPKGRSRRSKTGRRQHSRRFEMATRDSRVLDRGPELIGTLTVLGAVLFRLSMLACRWPVPARTSRREPPPYRGGRGWAIDPHSSFAVDLSPRRRTPGFGYLTRFLGEAPSRRGPRPERGANWHDGVDPNRIPCHPIIPPRRARRVRAMLV